MKVRITLTAEVDADAYQANYMSDATGKELREEVREYATDQARGAVELQFARLGWARIAE